MLDYHPLVFVSFVSSSITTSVFGVEENARSEGLRELSLRGVGDGVLHTGRALREGEASEGHVLVPRYRRAHVAFERFHQRYTEQCEWSLSVLAPRVPRDILKAILGNPPVEVLVLVDLESGG